MVQDFINDVQNITTPVAPKAANYQVKSIYPNTMLFMNKLYIFFNLLKLGTIHIW
jgi:hypothetical protein